MFRTYSHEYKKIGREKLLSKRHTETSSHPILTSEDDKTVLLWSNRNTVFFSSASKDTENWQRMKDEHIRCSGFVETCKMRKNSLNKIMYDLFYISNGEINFYMSKDFFSIVGEERKMVKNNNIKTRAEIEREKEQIMKQLGIRKSNDSFDFEAEEILQNKEPLRFSSEDSINNSQKRVPESIGNKEKEILKELQKISKTLSVLTYNIEKYTKNKKHKNVPNGNKRKISAKVHKK